MGTDVKAILKNLIQINTVNPPGNEKPAAVYLAELLKTYGFRCQVQELGDNRANLLAELGEEASPELMLNGHLDVVPTSGDWCSDPFEIFSQGDRIYGRGTSDMKGGVAAMCAAAIRIAQNGGLQKGKLKLLFVADEECSNLGTLHYLKEHKSGDYAIIGEPTNLKIAVAHRGVSRDYVDLFGPQRHAALPEDEEDAVSKTAKAIVAFRRMNGQLKSRKHEVLPSPSIALTMVQGYEKDNVIPGKIRLLLDFRILPGMKHEEVECILKTGLQEAGIRDYEIHSHFYMPGGELAVSDPFVEICRDAQRVVFGKEAETQEPCAFDASCEQCFFVEHGIRTIICGPGNIAQAHTVDEFISEKQLYQAVDFYEEVIKAILV